MCSAGLLVVVAPSLIGLTYRLLYVSHSPAPDLAFRANIASGATPSWYGPLGVIGLVAGIVVAAREVAKRLAPRIVLVLALSPVLLAVSLACTLVWDPWRGRFLIFAFVLAVAAWARMFAYRWLNWSVTTIGVVTLVILLLNSQSKPLGWDPLHARSVASVWGQSEWQVQTILRPSEDDELMLRFAAQRIPERAHIALAPRGNEFLRPTSAGISRVPSSWCGTEGPQVIAQNGCLRHRELGPRSALRIGMFCFVHKRAGSSCEGSGQPLIARANFSCERCSRHAP